MKINNKGFSLTEIIVTILIIAILASIAGPIYNSYSTKSKAAEGYLLLGTIKDAEMKWYQETNSFYNNEDYVNWSNDKCVAVDNKIGIDARANKYYTAFCIGKRTNNNSISVDPRKGFLALVVGKDVAYITMIYNIDSGTTIK